MYVQIYIFLATIHSIFWLPGYKNYLCISTLLASYIYCAFNFVNFFLITSQCLLSNRWRAISGIFLSLSQRILKLIYYLLVEVWNVVTYCMWYRKYSMVCFIHVVDFKNIFFFPLIQHESECIHGWRENESVFLCCYSSALLSVRLYHLRKKWFFLFLHIHLKFFFFF